MKWEKIEEQYKGEWVFVEVTAFSEDYNVIEGNVVIHDPDDGQFWDKVKKFEKDGKDFAVEYLGDVPENFGVML